MKHLPAVILVIVGAINFYPFIGVISADSLARLYDVKILSTDIEILMRHRAVFFGLIGSLLVVAAFRPALRRVACVAGLVSMGSFVWIALATGGFGDTFRTIILADVGGAIALLVVLALGNRKTRR